MSLPAEVTPARHVAFQGSARVHLYLSCPSSRSIVLSPLDEQVDPFDPQVCGMCLNHYKVRHGMKKPREYVSEDPGTRFQRKVQIDASGCWLWIGSLVYGYGKFGLRKGKVVSAHRWSYEQLVGPIPPGLQLDHLCRNTACVNPRHLEAVTAAENNRRSSSRSAQNSRKTHCKRGHELTGANLMLRHAVPGRSPQRLCRRCVNDRQRRQYAIRKGRVA